MNQRFMFYNQNLTLSSQKFKLLQEVYRGRMIWLEANFSSKSFLIFSLSREKLIGRERELLETQRVLEMKWNEWSDPLRTLSLDKC